MTPKTTAVLISKIAMITFTGTVLAHFGKIFAILIQPADTPTWYQRKVPRATVPAAARIRCAPDARLRRSLPDSFRFEADELPVTATRPKQDRKAFCRNLLRVDCVGFSMNDMRLLKCHLQTRQLFFIQTNGLFKN